MAVVTVYSDLRMNERATPPRHNKGSEDGPIKIFNVPAANFEAGDANSLVELFTLKANEVLLPDLFFFSHSAWIATSTIDIGYLGYTQPDGTAVAADPNGIATGIDGDAVAAGVSLAATKVVEKISFPVDVVITAQAVTAGYATSDTCSGVAIVSQHNV